MVGGLTYHLAREYIIKYKKSSWAIEVLVHALKCTQDLPFRPFLRKISLSCSISLETDIIIVLRCNWLTSLHTSTSECFHLWISGTICIKAKYSHKRWCWGNFSAPSKLGSGISSQFHWNFFKLFPLDYAEKITNWFNNFYKIPLELLCFFLFPQSTKYPGGP